jgi:hypothetical protein
MNAGVIVLFAAVIIVGVLLFAIMTVTKRGGVLDVDKYRVRWLSIEQSLDKANEASCHMAILNADKLVDQAMKDKGVSGNTMGERLKAASSSFTNRNDIWEAHKLRNKIAHEPDFRVGYDRSRRALAGFKRALKDLGAI